MSVRSSCSLARLQGELRPIFSAAADYSAEGNDVAYDMDTHFERSGSATFIMGKPDRSGYKPIVRKSGKAKMVFSWNGTEYLPEADSDPGCLAESCYCQDEYR